MTATICLILLVLLAARPVYLAVRLLLGLVAAVREQGEYDRAEVSDLGVRHELKRRAQEREAKGAT